MPLATISFGPTPNNNDDTTQNCLTSSPYEYLDKLQQIIDKRLHWDGTDRSQMLLPNPDGTCANNKGTSNTTGDCGGIGGNHLRDRQLVYIGRYLDANIKLWVWDFDDTLINSRAYYWHAMDSAYILSLPDSQLTRDVPYWRYWRRLVLYLVQSGRYVGIASFGYYPIIKAYMDRIFGPSQRIFNATNIHSVSYGCNGSRNWGNMPINKNAYIQRLMLHYKTPSPQQVILFDDRASNIADALRMGVVAIQIGYRLGRDGKRLDCQDLFGPHTMISVSHQLRNGQCVELLRNKENHTFGWLGDRKAWKTIAQEDAWIRNKRLQPNTHLQTDPTSNSTNNNNNSSNANNNDTNITTEENTHIKDNITTEENNTTTHENFMSHNNNNYNNNNYNHNNNYNYNTQNMNTQHSANNMPVCIDCQSTSASWIIVAVFLIMVCLIAGLVIWG